MSRLICGSWVCFNECWSKSPHSGEKTSIPVVLNYRSAAFILKRNNIKCEDPKEQSGGRPITDEMRSVFGNFPSSWYCDCYEVSGLAHKAKLPVVADVEMLEEWVAMTDSLDPPSDSVESSTASIAKNEVDQDGSEYKSGSSQLTLSQPMKSSTSSIAKEEIVEDDIEGDNPNPTSVQVNCFVANVTKNETDEDFFESNSSSAPSDQVESSTGNIAKEETEDDYEADSSNAPSDQVDYYFENIAKNEAEEDLVKSDTSNRPSGSSEPVNTCIENTAENEIYGNDVASDHNSEPVESSIANVSKCEIEEDNQNISETGIIKKNEKCLVQAVSMVTDYEDDLLISDSDGEEVPVNDNKGESWFQPYSAYDGKYDFSSVDYSYCENISCGSEGEEDELSLEQKELIARVRAKKSRQLRSVAYVERRVGEFLVECIDISFCFDADAALKGSLKKDDCWGGPVKRVTFRLYDDVKHFLPESILKSGEDEVVIKMEDSEDNGIQSTVCPSNAIESRTFCDLDSLGKVDRSVTGDATRGVPNEIRHACITNDESYIASDDHFNKDELLTESNLYSTHSDPNMNDMFHTSNRMEMCKDESLSENIWDHSLSVPNIEADHFHENRALHRFNGLRLTSDMQFDDEIHVRKFEDAIEDDIQVPRRSAASGSAMSILALEERQKRRRICRKLENNNENEDSAPFYPHGSYSELGEARRRILSKDVCVPIQCSSVLSQIAYRKLIVSTAEKNLQLAADCSKPSSSKSCQSIIKANEEYQKEAEQLRQSISQMKKDATNAVDGSNVVLQGTSRRNTHWHVHGRQRSQLSGTNPLQLYLPEGCNSVPDSWFQYSTFRGVSLYPTRDSVTKEAAALINKISNGRTVDSKKDDEKSVIRLIKEKIKNKNNRTSSYRKSAIQKATICKPRRHKEIVRLPNRFVQYAAENGSVSAAIRRQMTSSDYAGDFNTLTDWENNDGHRKEAPAFVQPSRVHFDLELVKSWKKENNEEAQNQSFVHTAGNFNPGYSGGLEPLRDQQCSSVDMFTLNEYPVDDFYETDNVLQSL